MSMDDSNTTDETKTIHDENTDDLYQPKLVRARNPIPDRRLLIYIIVLPYILCVVLGYICIFALNLDDARVSLATSAFLAPLGTIAGVIVAFYFKSTE